MHADPGILSLCRKFVEHIDKGRILELVNHDPVYGIREINRMFRGIISDRQDDLLHDIKGNPVERNDDGLPAQQHNGDFT